MPEHALATAYAAKFPPYGQTLDSVARADISGLGDLNDAESVTLLHAWLFGSRKNLAAQSGRVLDMVGTDDFVVDGATDPTLVVGPGSMTITGPSAVLTSPSPLFTNDSWTMLMMLNKSSASSGGVGDPGVDERSIFLIQYSGGSTGSCYLDGIYTEAVRLTIAGNDVIPLHAQALPAQAPVVAWLTYNHATRQLFAYDAHSGATLGGATLVDTGGGNTWETGVDAQIGLSGVAPNMMQFGGIFKFSGVLNEAKRDALFGIDRTDTDHRVMDPNCYYGVMSRFNKRVFFGPGNSGTNGSDASIYSLSHVSKTKRSLAENASGYLWVLSPMGAKGIYHQRPADYELPPARALVLGELEAREPAIAVENVADKLINIVVVNDDQNSLVGLGAEHGGEEMLYSDFLDVLDAYLGVLRTAYPGLKVVGETPLAWWAIDYQTLDPLDYAATVASAHRQRMLEWAELIREDDWWDVLWDHYAAINLGWPEQGSNPITNLPNGDPTLFLDDPQHLNDAGHLVRFNGLRDVIHSLSLPELEASESTGGGLAWKQLARSLALQAGYTVSP